MDSELLNEKSDTVLAATDKEIFSPTLFFTLLTIHLLAIPAFWYLSSANLVGWMIAHYYFTTVGIALGQHRYFSHRSFRTDHPFIERWLALTSTLCFQGGPLFWAASHRAHHLFTEQFGDPHSAARGFFWSHFKWMLYSNPNGFSFMKAMRLIRDWRKDKFLMMLEVHNLKINLGFLGGLFLACWAVGKPSLFFWIGPLRIVTVWHSTWLINSFAHRARFWGPYRSQRLRDSILMSVALGGEGDHDFHHRHPSSVRHSNRRIHLDHAYYLLRILKALKLVSFREPTTKLSVPDSADLSDAA